ncbi:Pesticin receptor [BD1-7 clade bacterium]|uniref:Pesticin receptor n=1 Tax=BD1-7 clade bacterium TaxID=2029982 RepID=A0A5S9N824_9GAMM|nr:Pesticin receptor [BD1-7 clade bacterium]
MLIRFATTFTSLALATSAAYANDTTEQSNQDASRTKVIVEEVIVTGQKVERSQMDTVTSVSVISGEAIDDATGLDDFYDILERMPNVARNGSFDFSIRGISGNGPTNANNGASTIGVFLDNSTLTARSLQAGALSTWDVESVEVLRGPQSTTSGRNSLAGAIYINTRDPEFNYDGKARASYGEYNTYQVAIAQNVAVTDFMAFRLTADRQHTDNFVENKTIDGNDWDRESNTLVRGKLLFTLPGDGDLLFTASNSKFEDYGDDGVINNVEDRVNIFNTPTTWFTDVNNYSIEYTQPLTDVLSFSSNTGYVESTFDRDSDADGQAGEANLKQDSIEDNFSQEFLLNVQADNLRAVIGLWYANGALDDSYSTRDSLVDADEGGPIPAVLLDFSNESRENYENAALFMDFDIVLSDYFTLLTGLRADYERRESRILSSGERKSSTGIPQADALIDALISSQAGVSRGASDSFNLLPKLGFNLTWNDDLTTGFVVQRGYRPGGVSLNVLRSQAHEYDAEFTTNYELSMRAEFWDDRVLLTTNIFYTDWQNQQVNVEGEGGRFDSMIVNAGKSHLYGFELASNIFLMDGWTLDAGIGFTKTRFDEFEEPSVGADYAGDEFPAARKWTGNIGTTYRDPSGFFVSANTSFGSTAAPRLGTDLTLDSYTLVNVKTGYEAKHWAAYLYANNLLDDVYALERYETSQFGDAVLGAPRVVGLVTEFNW